MTASIFSMLKYQISKKPMCDLKVEELFGIDLFGNTDIQNSMKIQHDSAALKRQNLDVKSDHRNSRFS